MTVCARDQAVGQHCHVYGYTLGDVTTRTPSVAILERAAAMPVHPPGPDEYTPERDRGERRPWGAPPGWASCGGDLPLHLADGWTTCAIAHANSLPDGRGGSARLAHKGLTCVHPCCGANIMPMKPALNNHPTRPYPGGAFSLLGGGLAEASPSDRRA